MSEMTSDEARAVLARIGATEESTAEEVQAKAFVVWLHGDDDQYKPLRAYDALRAAKRDALRGLVRRLAEGLRSIDACSSESNCATCCFSSQYTCDDECRVLLLEARQALEEGEQ